MRRFGSMSGTLLLGLAVSISVSSQTSAGVDQDLPPYVAERSVSGHVTISGSETMHPLILRLASEFHRYQRDVKVAVEGGGSEDAIDRFVQGIALVRTGEGGTDSGHDGARQAAFLAASRELSADELRQFVSRHGHEPVALPIAVDAVAVYVHRDNPVRGLTLSELDAMLSRSPKRGAQRNIERWGELGLNGTWAEAQIHLYGRDLKSGTRAFVKEQVLKNGEFRASVQEVPGAASMIMAVSRDPVALGYGGIGWQASGVRTVPLAEASGQPFVAPNRETAFDGTYPLRRILYLYVNKASRHVLNAAATEFLRFIYSRQGQEAVMKGGFYPLRQEQIPKALADLIALR
jgi:phosphate transport system substrate-binding protein